METSIKVTFTAKEVGDFSADLYVSSEINTFSLSVSAKVAPVMSHLESQDSMFASDAPKPAVSMQ